MVHLHSLQMEIDPILEDLDSLFPDYSLELLFIPFSTIYRNCCYKEIICNSNVERHLSMLIQNKPWEWMFSSKHYIIIYTTLHWVLFTGFFSLISELVILFIQVRCEIYSCIYNSTIKMESLIVTSQYYTKSTQY